MTTTAVVLFSDPKSGSDEALGRLLNALILVHELKERGEPVSLAFQGAGSRWAGEIVKPDHPAHALFKSVEDKVLGVCGGCADVFGARDDVEASGLKLIHEREVPGTSGVLDLSKFIVDGDRLVVF